MNKYKYHRTEDRFFSGRCMGARCWSCHAQGRKKDLYGDPLKFGDTHNYDCDKVKDIYINESKHEKEG